MNRLVGLCSLFLMAAAVPALPATATTSDLRRLRAEVERLDDAMWQVESDHPRAREFRQREQEIRDELVALRRDIRDDGRGGVGASDADVDRLMRRITNLRNDIEMAVGSDARGPGEMTVPEGTEIPVRLERGLSSATARTEDRVEGVVTESVRVDGRVAIPAGTLVRGTVRQVERARRPSHGGRLELSFDSMAMDNRTVDLRARVVSLEEDRVDKSKAGLGALLGGVVGAVIDGKKGALIGALVGGGGAIAASSGDEVELPAGTVMIVRLERSLYLARR